MARQATIVGRGGLRGVVESPGWSGSGEGYVDVRLDDGRRLSLPAALLESIDRNCYFLPLAKDDLPHPAEGGERLGDSDVQAGETHVIPVVEEQLDLARRTVETGRVRLVKTVQTVEEEIDAATVREQVEVERVPIGRQVEKAVPTRREGDTLIIPLHEEVIVVERRLVLREEVRLTRRRVVESDPRQVTLRREEVAVERIPPRRDASS